MSIARAASWTRSPATRTPGGIESLQIDHATRNDVQRDHATSAARRGNDLCAADGKRGDESAVLDRQHRVVFRRPVDRGIGNDVALGVSRTRGQAEGVADFDHRRRRKDHDVRHVRPARRVLRRRTDRSVGREASGFRVVRRCELDQLFANRIVFAVEDRAHRGKRVRQRWPALVRLLRQHAHDRFVELRRTLGPRLTNGARLNLRVRVHDDEIRSDERRRARQHLVRHDAERVLIDLGANLASENLLGRHVRRRADDRARLRLVRRFGELRDSEVGDDRGSVDRAHEHVAWLDVAVVNLATVCVGETAADLIEQCAHGGNREHTVATDDHVERSAAHEVHHEEEKSFALEHAVHGPDVRMLETRAGFRFAAEAIDHVRVRREHRRHDFERDFTVEADVVGQEDGGHAAASELADDLVLADRRGLEFFEDSGPRRQHWRVRVGSPRHSCRHCRRLGGHAAGRAETIPGQKALTATTTSVYERTAPPAKAVKGLQCIAANATRDARCGLRKPFLHTKPRLLVGADRADNSSIQPTRLRGPASRKGSAVGRFCCTGRRWRTTLYGTP